MVSLQRRWCKDLVEYRPYAISNMFLIILLFPIYRFFNLMLLVDVQIPSSKLEDAREKENSAKEEKV